MSNYPEGAKDDPQAPWNEQPEEMEEIDVEVVLIISRNATVRVRKGYGNKDIQEAIEFQVEKPNNVVHPIYGMLKDIVGSDDKDWIINDVDWEEI